MPYPSIYDVTYSYTGFQQAQGDNSFPGTQIDADLAGLRASVSNLALFTQGAMRSDGALQNGSVTFDSLSPALQTNGIATATAWVTGVSYVVGSPVVQNGSLYRGAIAHTSGVFATDLAAGKWLLVSTLGVFTQTGAGAVARAVTDKLTDVISIMDFIPGAQHAGILDGTNATDLATYLAAAWAAVTARSPMPALVFPAGVYLASAFPNFAVANAVVLAGGEVRLRYTGTSHAIFLDGGTGLLGINNVTFGGPNPFIIECPKTGQDGFRVRNVHRSRVNGPNVRGAGWTAGVPAFAGIRALGCVCTKFDVPTVSSNVEAVAWYNGAKPLHGILLDERAVGAQTSYCAIINPAVDGPTYGVYHASALGNVILGGTAEGCSDTGLYYDTNSTNNRAIGCDVEANGVRDVLLAGTRNALVECDTADLILVSGNAFRPRVDGGAHHQITIAVGVNNAQLGAFGFNRKATTGAVTDGGTATQIRDAINLGTTAYTGKVARADLNLSDLASLKAAYDNISVHGADVVAAATIDLDAATGNLVDVTGNTGITAITLAEGRERTVRFTGTPTLTNGASLVLPGAQNIIAAAGDFAVFRGYAAGVVRCVNYLRAANFAPWPATAPVPTSAGGAFTTASSILHTARDGKDAKIGGSITLTTIGGVASGALQLTMPFTAAVTMALAAINASTGAAAGAWMNSGSNVLNISPPAAFANGHLYYFGGVIEAQ